MRYLPLFLFFLLVSAFPTRSQAVVISGDLPLGVLPGDGWDYVGAVNNASGVYLGQYGGLGWVLTANHVGAGNFSINGQTYLWQSGTKYVIHQPGNPSQLHDLALFAIELTDGSPLLSLPNLTLASTTLVGEEVRMIGRGSFSRQPNLTYWEKVGSTWVETTTPGEGAVAGYKYGNGAGPKSWGLNTIAFKDDGVSIDPTGQFLFTAFEQEDGSAQGAPGDSGGGVFQFNATTLEWELAGIMAYIGTPEGLPHGDGFAVFSKLTLSYDLAVYQEQIYAHLAAIPEPGSVSLLLLAGAAGYFSWRRRLLRPA